MKTLPLATRFLILFMPLPLAGCTNLAEGLATHFAEESVKSSHDLVLFEGDLAAFRGCLKQTGGTCPQSSAAALQTNTTPASASLSKDGATSLNTLPTGHPARMAHNVLTHPVMRQAVDLHNHIRGHGSGSLKSEEAGICSKIRVPISTHQTADLHSSIVRATAANGWAALHKHTQQALAASQPSDPDHARRKTDARKAKFLKAYVEAFFGNGHVLSVHLDIPPAQAEAYIARELGRHAKTACVIHNARIAASGPETSALGDLSEAESELGQLHSLGTVRRIFSFINQASSDAAEAEADAQACTSLATSIYNTVRRISRAGTVHHAVKVTQPGFISRDADFAAQVPSIAINIDPLNKHAHTVTLEMNPAAPNGKFNYTEIGTDLVRVVLEAVFDANEELPAAPHATASAHSLLPPISADMSDHLNRMNGINDNVQFTLGILVDRIIKGIGPISLNNDALEATITTIVATSARKAAEKATWCWYACNLNEDSDNLYRDARVNIDAEKKKVEDKIKRHALEAAQHVCLSLHVGK